MRPSPQPSAFPALGRDVGIDCRTHPKDLSAQKLSLSAPAIAASAIGNVQATRRTVNQSWSDARGVAPVTLTDNAHMDIGIVAAIAMLAVWALGTFVYEAPGWIHLLLSVGLFVLMWRIVVRGTSRDVPRARSKRGERTKR